MLENKSYSLLTFGDWIFEYQLKIEASQKHINLGPHFQTHVNFLKIILPLYGYEKIAKLVKPESLVSEFGIGKSLVEIQLKSTYHCALMSEFFKDKLIPDFYNALTSNNQAQSAQTMCDFSYSPTNVIDQ